MELVLGGEGLIGQAVSRLLQSNGLRVKSLDLKNGFDLRHATPEWFDRADRVWFLAWDTGGAKYLQDDALQHSMYLHNTELCMRVFDVIGARQLPFLFVSSQLAGEPSAYGVTKLLGERWATQLGGKVAKLWNVYGWETPGQRSHVVPDLVLSGVQHGVVTCGTSGAERRQLIYKTDCALALLHLFESGQQYADITSGEWVSIRHVAEVVATQLGAKISAGDRAGSESRNSPEVRLEGWSPTVSLHEGIREVISEATAWVRTAQNS